MADFQLKNHTFHTCGDIYALGQKAPNFLLTASDFSEVSLNDFLGQPLILNIFPSIDTSLCIGSCDRFNQLACKDITVLCISCDLPFAMHRMEQQKQYNHVRLLSDFRYNDFGELYGLSITDGPLKGFLAREVMVLDADHYIMYQDYVENINKSPECELAIEIIEALRKGVPNES
jgi:thioredoxin-dependent peroxiredoxin